MLVVIDNYDSFTYNLVQYLWEYEKEIWVYRNDGVSVEEIEGLDPCGIVISPGPGGPEDSGVSVEVVKKLSRDRKILGVCLGHQVMGYGFGGRVVRAREVMHGKRSWVDHDGKGIYEGLRSPMGVGRYHSLVLEEESLPGCFEVSARSEDGVVMGIRHREYRMEGVQFHPESILSESGKELLRNFINF